MAKEAMAKEAMAKEAMAREAMEKEEERAKDAGIVEATTWLGIAPKEEEREIVKEKEKEEKG